MSTMVNCVTCQRGLPEQDAFRTQVWEVIDGDTNNLTTANLRDTGKVLYYCHLCLLMDDLEVPALAMTSQSFERGYSVGMQEARTWQVREELSDEELLTGLKRVFVEYRDQPNEEALSFSIGTTIGLVVGMTILPIIDAYKESLPEGHQNRF